MAEIVMVPFSGFLAQAMSTRLLFASSAALFTLSSVACGFAWNIESMIVFRAIQGFTGGAMIPTVFSVGFSLFSEKERTMVPAILGMVSVLAPTLGPTAGGLITEYLSWHWIFFINVIPGIAVTILALRLLHLDTASPAMFRRIDWLHFFSMAVFLGCLEYVLEEGPRVEWFSDATIMICAWISLVAFVVFIERSLYSGMPILKLTPFRQRNFTFACVFNLVVGFGLFASTYLVPVFLGRVRDFNSLQIGTTVFVVGIAQHFSTIVAAKLAEKIDLRIILAAGLGLFSLSLWMTAQATSEWGFSEFLVPQLVRGFAIMLCIVPSVGTALSGFSGAKLKYASGLFNVMRNLGGAIGIAVVNTWLQDNARISGARFGENLGAFPGTFSSTITELTGYVSSTTTDAQLALMQARGLLRDIISQQAFTLAFDDVFIMMSGMFLFALILVPFARTPGAGRSPSPGDGH